MKITDVYLEVADLKFQARLRGHLKISRGRYLLLINKDLSEIEFSIYTLISDVLVDWDSRHAEYGLFEFKYPLISRHLGWKEGKLRRILGSLMKKGFVMEVADDKYSLIGYNLQKSIHMKSEEFNYYDELKKQLSTTLKSR